MNSKKESEALALEADEVLRFQAELINLHKTNTHIQSGARLTPFFPFLFLVAVFSPLSMPRIRFESCLRLLHIAIYSFGSIYVDRRNVCKTQTQQNKEISPLVIRQ